MTATMVDVGAFRERFFQVLQETARSQTAVMTIAPGQDAGPEETHAADQLVYVIEGEAVIRVGDSEHHAKPGACAMIPAGSRHHVRNPGAASLFFLTIYAPPAY